jgi:hypothetical protein
MAPKPRFSQMSYRLKKVLKLPENPCYISPKRTSSQSIIAISLQYCYSVPNSMSPGLLNQIEDNVLMRSSAVKWFDKFNRDRIFNFVYNEFSIKQVKKIEDKPSSSNSFVKDFLNGKFSEELVEIAQMTAIQCCQSTSSKHSPTSFEGSSSAKPYTPVSFPPKWY